MEEAHSSAYAMHPVSTKKYHTLKEHYWWKGMKRDIAEFVSRCLTCQQVKAEHQKPAGLLQSLPIPQWKWERITMDFVVGLEIVQVTCDKVKVIRDRLKIAQNRHKSYADNRCRDLEFEVGDMVFLKISPWKGVLRFGKRGKQSPRYIGPYRIVERIGEVGYRLELPSDLDRIHDVFHVSMLSKYIPDPSHVLTEKPVEIQENLTYEEEPMQILDHREQVLRNKTIPLVKVL